MGHAASSSPDVLNNGAMARQVGGGWVGRRDHGLGGTKAGTGFGARVGGASMSTGDISLLRRMDLSPAAALQVMLDDAESSRARQTDPAEHPGLPAASLYIITCISIYLYTDYLHTLAVTHRP